MSESELRAGLDHHDRVRAAMAAMHRTTADLTTKARGDYMESRRNRRPGDAKPDQNMGHAMAQYRAFRLEDLAAQEGPLFFGRLWLDSGEQYHLGRRHVRDEFDRSISLVIDWRAPLAERF